MTCVPLAYKGVELLFGFEGVFARFTILNGILTSLALIAGLSVQDLLTYALLSSL